VHKFNAQPKVQHDAIRSAYLKEFALQVRLWDSSAAGQLQNGAAVQELKDWSEHRQEEAAKEEPSHGESVRKRACSQARA